jgi:hypothetical protein
MTTAAGESAVARREKAVMLALWVLAASACLLGAFAKPPESVLGDRSAQLIDLVRVLCTTALVLVLLLGPGAILRSLSGRREIGLGFLPLPGLVLLLGTGGIAWALAGSVGAHAISLAILGPILLALAAGVIWSPQPGGLFDPEERRALLAVGLLLALAIARALWSLGPDGELFAGTISRTFEVGSRPDSRIPFHVVQLVAHGTAPYSELGASYFSPYNFSSRGPLAGIANAPLVLLAGGKPPTTMPEQAWSPFDAQGFMAFRLAAMAFSCTALLSLWTLTRRLAGARAAQLAVLLAATTPFLLHETWFTWPKLLAASMVLLAAVSLIDGRPLRAGLLVGIGYLVHPMALLSAPALLLLALWPLIGARLRRPQLKPALLVLLGIGAFAVLWRLVNGDHYQQDGFLDYLTEAGPGVPGSPWGEPGAWLSHRLESLGNTVVPMMLALFHGDDQAINFFGGSSPPLIHIYFQYWNTLPFGVAIVFFPLLLLSLWRAWRRWPWPVTVAVVVPFLTFLVYWGSYATGMLPEGMQTWVLTLFAVVAVQQRHAAFAWLRSTPIRIVLMLRALELLAAATVPTLATRGQLSSSGYGLVDAVALLGIVGSCAGLAALVWSERAPARCRPSPNATATNPARQTTAASAVNNE